MGHSVKCLSHAAWTRRPCDIWHGNSGLLAWDNGLRAATERKSATSNLSSSYTPHIQPLAHALLPSKTPGLRKCACNKNAPPVCRSKERWGDRKCLGYCAVAATRPYAVQLRNNKYAEKESAWYVIIRKTGFYYARLRLYPNKEAMIIITTVITAADVMEKINAALVKHQVASVVTPELLELWEVTNAKGNSERLATVKTTVSFVDSESGESLQFIGLGKWSGYGDKAVMKAQTASLKYAYLMTLAIATGDDPEADSAVDERMQHKNASSSSRAAQIRPGSRRKCSLYLPRLRRRLLLKEFTRCLWANSSVPCAWIAKRNPCKLPNRKDASKLWLTQVETMFYTREAPWHGLGVHVKEALSAKEALLAAGLDWEVTQREIQTSDNLLVPGYKSQYSFFRLRKY